MIKSSVYKGLIAIALLCISWGCSSIRVSQDYDLSRDFSLLKTFAWQSEIQPQTGDIRVDSSLLDSRIRSAIDATLFEKGYQKVDQGEPDFHVAYTYQISSKVESDNVTFGFGFGSGSRGSYGGIGLNSGGSVREYDEGLLLIYLLDGFNEDLLWRGIGTTRVDQHTEPEEAVKYINEVVEKILSQFPPQTK